VNKLAGIKIYDMQCNQNLAAACLLPAQEEPARLFVFVTLLEACLFA
jgi:hypothetical protein